MSRILVVEDEIAIAELIALNLRHAGHEVSIAVDAEQDFLLDHRRASELQPKPGRLSIQSLGTHPHGHIHLVFHEGHIGGEDGSPDDVARGGDADTVDVERDSVLAQQCGNFARL